MKIFRVLFLSTGSMIAAAQGASAQQAVGCWVNSSNDRDHRQICILPDQRVFLSTFRAGGGSSCYIYPPSYADMRDRRVSFEIRPGVNNCILQGGAQADSVRGVFSCDLSDSSRMVCQVNWEGWEGVQEVYDKR